MQKYIMALDQGTTSSRCILFDKEGNICSMAQKEFTQVYPKPGWVEHNPREIWVSQLAVATEAMANISVSAKDIAAIGITNQRETTIVWDKTTGKPVYNAIVWQCRRTAEVIDELKERGYEDIIRKKTGLIPDAYFSASKIAWILEHFIRAALESIAYQTVDVLKAMQEDAGVPMHELKVDGGASANEFLMQFQADIAGHSVYRPSCIETTALGAAYLAGLAIGYWKDKEEICANWKLDKRFDADMEDERRKELLKGWKKAVKCALVWAEE